MRLSVKVFWLFCFLILLAVVSDKIIGQIKRPPRQNMSEELFQGVTYTRLVRSSPRPLVIHMVEIDLSFPFIDFLVTPGDETIEMDLLARTTTSFATEFGTQLAINGSFFEPFSAQMPWNYYPRLGDPVNIKGLAMSNHQVYSDDFQEWPVLCLSPEQAQIRHAGCDEKTTQALAGSLILLEGGLVMASAEDMILHPRTAVAVDVNGTRLWLIVVDGRQPKYSEGVTLWELAEIALEAGAEAALNLDGGGSSTMVITGVKGVQVLNAPFHTNVPMRERPVGNHLGIFALPIEQ